MGLGSSIKKYGGKAIGAIHSGGLSLLGGKGGGGGMRPPGYKGPKFGIAKTESFIKNEEAPQLFGKDVEGAIGQRFQRQRERASQEINAGNQAQLEAIKRRFSSMGGGPSGAQIKLEQQALESGEKAKQQALLDLSEQEETQKMQRGLAQAEIDFKQKALNFEKGSKLHELNLAERQQQIAQSENAYSARLNQFLNQPPKEGLVSKILGPLL